MSPYGVTKPQWVNVSGSILKISCRQKYLSWHSSKSIWRCQYLHGVLHCFQPTWYNYRIFWTYYNMDNIFTKETLYFLMLLFILVIMIDFPWQIKLQISWKLANTLKGQHIYMISAQHSLQASGNPSFTETTRMTGIHTETAWNFCISWLPSGHIMHMLLVFCDSKLFMLMNSYTAQND